MVEFDFGLEPQTARMRPQFAVALALADADRLEHLDVAALRRERDDAGLIDRGDERRGAAVHDRHFRSVDLDDRVVDAAAVQRGEHMFGGGYRRAVMVAENGGEFGRGHGAVIGAEFAIGLSACAAAQKYDAGIGFGRMQCEIGGCAGMNADTGYGDMISQRRLPAGLRAPRHGSVPHLTAKLRGQNCPDNCGHPTLRERNLDCRLRSVGAVAKRSVPVNVKSRENPDPQNSPYDA